MEATDKTQKHEVRKHKVFEINAFNRKFNVIVSEEKERPSGNRCLIAWTVLDDGTIEEPFGELTKVLHIEPDKDCLFVKTYSENKGWAEKLCKEIGGKPTGRTAVSGYTYLPEYNFKNINIYE